MATAISSIEAIASNDQFKSAPFDMGEPFELVAKSTLAHLDAFDLKDFDQLHFCIFRFRDLFSWHERMDLFLDPRFEEFSRPIFALDAFLRNHFQQVSGELLDELEGRLLLLTSDQNDPGEPFIWESCHCDGTRNPKLFEAIGHNEPSFYQDQSHHTFLLVCYVS